MMCNSSSGHPQLWRGICPVVIFILAFECHADGDDDKSFRSESAIIENLDWKEVNVEKQKEIFELLASQTKGNYTKIGTWEGNCLVHIENLLSETIAARYLHVHNSGPLVQQSEFTLKFVIDIPSRSYFRSKENSGLKFLDENLEHEVDVPNVHTSDDRSVITPEHYIQFNPTMISPGFHSLQTYPQAMNKRAAFRRPSEIGLQQSQGDLVDPLDFFGFSPGQRFWDSLNLYIPFVNGEKGEELLKKSRDRISVFEAEVEKAVFYKIVIKYNDSKIFYGISIWSSSFGFNPVSQVLSIDKKGENSFQYKQWKWKVIDDIFIPTYVSEIRHRREDGQIIYQRTVKLEDCLMNQPIDEQQFSYQGLGMKEGEIVKDDIEKAFYFIKNGKPTKLANFGETNDISGQQRKELLTSRQWMIIGNLIFFVVLITLLWMKRRKTKTN